MHTCTHSHHPLTPTDGHTRTHTHTGATTTVELVVTPKYHSVVSNEGRDGFWGPKIMVEAGAFELYVGGGQPDFAKGVLRATVSVSKHGMLTTQYQC